MTSCTILGSKLLFLFSNLLYSECIVFVQSPSRVPLFVIPRTAALQASLSLPIPWHVYKPLALRVSTCQARGLCFIPVHLGLQLESSDLLKVHLGLCKWLRDVGSKMKLGRSSCSSLLRRIPPTQGYFLKRRKCSICVPSAPGPTPHVAGTPPVS